MTRLRLALPLLAFLALTTLCSYSHAATGTAPGTWTTPVKYDTGDALPASAITGYAVGCRFTPTGGTAAPCSSFTPATFPGTATSGTVTVSNLSPVGGQLCLSLATMTAQITGPPSPESCKAIPPANPNAPGNVTFTITIAINLQSDTPIRVAVADPIVTKEGNQP